MKIDDYLPRYDFNEIHHVTVNATPEKTIAAVKELLPSELSPVVFWMLNLRSLPARLTGNAAQSMSNEQPFLAQLLENGFLLLSDDGSELVFGLIGQFWKLAGSQEPGVRDPQGFLDFNKSDFAKVAANLAVEQRGNQTFLSTETRIAAPDRQTLRKFAFYWRVISFGSGWIRVMWLNGIKRKAERM